jgi:hypothetical protein
MKKSLVIIALFALMTGWYSCTKDTAIPPPAAPVCDSTHVSYARSIVPLINNNCALSGCHGNPPGSGANDLTNYIEVRAEMEADSPAVNSILCRVQSTACGDLMPKGSGYGRGLSVAEIDTLILWKAGGYCE